MVNGRMVFLVILVTSDYLNHTYGCEPDWYGFQGHCYRIIDQAEPLQYGNLEGRLICRRLGSDLVTIKSYAESNFLLSLVQPNNHNGYTGIIGMSDALSEGYFTYLDGTPLQYSNWGLGEPNNWANSEGGESCVIMLLENHGRYFAGDWNDGPCLLNYHRVTAVICEKDDVSNGISQRYYIKIDNHYFTEGTIDSMFVSTKYNCLIQCNVNPECLSVNFDTSSTNSPGAGVNCILNNATRYEMKSNFINAGNYSGHWVYMEARQPGI